MIKILFFGILADKTGLKEFEMQAKDIRLSDILKELKKRFPKLPDGAYMLAVNENQAAPETIVKDGDEVAIMPPFSGG